MPPPASSSCAACVFLVVSTSTFNGHEQTEQCRRFPPVSHGPGQHTPAWSFPSVKPDFWCGEFKNK